MIDDEDRALRPLPIVLRPQPDELLSSWLLRHAAYYNVGPHQLLQHVGLSAPSLQHLDHHLTLAQAIVLAGFFRREPADVAAMMYAGIPDDLRRLIRRGRVLQTCRHCASRHEQDDAKGAILRSWMQAWRLTCRACGSTLSDLSTPNVERAAAQATIFADHWNLAREGEGIVERYATRIVVAGLSPVAVMRLLMLPRWPAPAEIVDGYHPSRLLNVLAPGFDNAIHENGLSQAIRGKLILPIAIRTAVLAGLALAMKAPGETVAQLRAATRGQGRTRFDEIAGLTTGTAVGPFSVGS